MDSTGVPYICVGDDMNNLYGKEILVTGGTGSLGHALTREILTNHKPKGIRILSRNEEKQRIMRVTIDKEFPDAPISYILGDVRDRQRTSLASRNVNIILHCAALKQICACRENPVEAVNTNIVGSTNVLLAALDNAVGKVIGISTDKACAPSTVYGASKRVMEDVFINGNTYSGNRAPWFSICRYGNILRSTGSIVPLFKQQYALDKTITVTSTQMTRFFMTLSTVAKFILRSINDMEGGEIFVPFMRATNIMTIADYATGNTDYSVKEIGIRQDEKLHETLVTSEESRHAFIDEENQRFVIRKDREYTQLSFTCSSDKEPPMTVEQLKELIEGPNNDSDR